MLISEKYLSKLQNETKFMKIGHTMPELQPFTFHQKLVTHPVYISALIIKLIYQHKLFNSFYFFMCCGSVTF